MRVWCGEPLVYWVKQCYGWDLVLVLLFVLFPFLFSLYPCLLWLAAFMCFPVSAAGGRDIACSGCAVRVKRIVMVESYLKSLKIDCCGQLCNHQHAPICNPFFFLWGLVSCFICISKQNLILYVFTLLIYKETKLTNLGSMFYHETNLKMLLLDWKQWVYLDKKEKTKFFLGSFSATVTFHFIFNIEQNFREL